MKRPRRYRIRLADVPAGPVAPVPGQLPLWPGPEPGEVSMDTGLVPRLPADSGRSVHGLSTPKTR